MLVSVQLFFELVYRGVGVGNGGEKVGVVWWVWKGASFFFFVMGGLGNLSTSLHLN